MWRFVAIMQRSLLHAFFGDSFVDGGWLRALFYSVGLETWAADARS